MIGIMGGFGFFFDQKTHCFFSFGVEGFHMAWVTILGSVCVLVGMKVLSVQNLRLKDVDQNYGKNIS